MQRTAFLLFLFLIPFVTHAQPNNENQPPDLTIIFDAGILIGHSEDYYPSPFTSTVSVLKNFNNRIWIGGGAGAKIIGKTFIPVYTDFRLIPFSSKPIFIYNRLGWSFSANKNYGDADDSGYYYNPFPHPLNENVTTKGGIMEEAGIGFLLDRSGWSTSFSIGYQYQKTQDKVTLPHSKTYENLFNRIAVRVGFWF